MQGSGTEAHQVGFIKQYSPSWVDYLNRGINRLPGSVWIYYVILALVLSLVQAIALSLDGILVPAGLDRAQIFMAIAVPSMLALVFYFNNMAKHNFRKLRPSIKLDQAQAVLLEKNLVTLPAVWTLVAGVLGLGSVFFLEAISGAPYQIFSTVNAPFSGYLFRILYLFLWWVFGTFIYHTIHQLSIIGRINSQLIEINFYQPKNLYTFSNLIALTAFFTFLLPVGFLLANPWASWEEPVVFGTVLVVQLVALATFIWPHFGIHQLQVAEKEKLLENANKRLEQVSQLLHMTVDQKKLDRIGEVSTTISVLSRELSMIEKMPTWPWHPETLRFLITALALPLGIWLIQLLLGRLLGSG